MLRRLLVPVACFLFAITASNAPAQSAVTLKADTANVGRAIPADFCGLSYEIKLVLPRPDSGKHYFRSDNQPLINVFKTLGIKHLRVGGNTAERITVDIPNRTDIDAFFGFVKAADVKAIYTVRMESNAPTASAEIAKYVMDKYGSLVDCLTVGNEPDKPWKTYAPYAEEWKKYTTVILSPEYAPTAKFCAPSTTPRGVPYAKAMAEDIGKWEHLAYITQHYYPRGGGGAVTNATIAARDRGILLGTNMYSVYQRFHDQFVPAVKAKGLNYRMEEANSYSNGGAEGVSDNFTASLWIVDFLYWWAQHDAIGINFHTGEKVARGTVGPDRPNVYTAFTSSPNGYTLLPTGYGMKLFNLGSQGRLVPINVAANADNLNLVAYGALASDKTLCVTILNREYDTAGRAAKVTINTGTPSTRAEMISMTAPGGVITSISGITIGGSGIDEQGNWTGKWTQLPAPEKDGSITVTVPAATGVVVKLQP